MSRAARSSGVVGVGGLAARLGQNPKNVVMIDPSIDRTGASEVSALLKPYATDTTLVPDGTPLLPTVVRFQPGALYNSEDVWQFTHRFNVILDFNGGELRANVANPYGLEAASDIDNNWFTYRDHGLDGSAPMQISGGLSNTKGIAARTTYWPKLIPGDPNHFRLSTTQGGPAITLTGSADSKVNFRNAASPNPRAFLFSNDFPGNFNFARSQLVLEGCTNCQVTDLSGNGGTVTGAAFYGPGGTRSTSGAYDAADGGRGPTYGGQVGVLLLGGVNCQVGGTVNARLTIQYTLGDSGENIASSTYGPGAFLRWHDLNMIGAGRQGWSVGNGGATAVTLEDCSIIGAARHLRDIEADNPDGSADIDAVTMRRLYLRCGTNTLGDLAMGGESTHVANIVNGGLEGHPLDGNLTVGTNARAFCMDVDSPFPTDQGPVRRGPITYNYNVGGGQIQLRTVQGSPTATYTGLFNPTSFTDTQLLQFQPISASTLPTPCQINTVDETTRTVTLSHPAQSGGTQIVTATFGGVAQGAAPVNLGNFTLRSGWDGITGIGNVFVVQSGPAFDLDYCSGYQGNIHDNIVIGGSELRATNPYVAPKTIALAGFAVPKRFGTDTPSLGTVGGSASVRAAIGLGLDVPTFLGSEISRWTGYAPAGVAPGFKWNNTFPHSGLASEFGSTGLRCVIRINNFDNLNIHGTNVGYTLTELANGTANGDLDNAGIWIQQLETAQGQSQYVELLTEGDGGWEPWDGNANPGLYIQAFNHMAGRILAKAPNTKIGFCSGGLGYGGGPSRFNPGSNTVPTQMWDVYCDGVGNPLGSGLGIQPFITVWGLDPYSNGPSTAAWVKIQAEGWRAWAIGRGFEIGHREVGIGDRLESVPPHNIEPGTWWTTLLAFWKSCPSGPANQKIPGRIRYICLFDQCCPGSFPDGRTVSFSINTWPGNSDNDGKTSGDTLKTGWQ